LIFEDESQLGCPTFVSSKFFEKNNSTMPKRPPKIAESTKQMKNKLQETIQIYFYTT